MLSKSIFDEYFSALIFSFCSVKENLFFILKVISWSLIKFKSFSNISLNSSKFVVFFFVPISPVTFFLPSESVNITILSDRSFIFL